MQEIIASFDGTVSISNNAIYPIEPGDNIFQLHPFFQSLELSILNGNNIYFTFPCINLLLGERNYYCDVIIKKEKDFMAVLLFNYSDHYREMQEKIQKIKGEKFKS
ncbi:MAG: hypothetical protein KJO05_04470 [Bacteroidia bacterium]|nr:hypothetical protein [Bacteroidia bacterium]NNF30691.1 hypothetical protein [Flavobacteriaceae bacterium]MBT8277264.1 hypothetical protein [Bacteroidia bacterium]NNJ80789.1 hypothetical protein [Flavobacteriaceae bacterium]NNK54864.1 hypothetical protein [Flavobacteriaceae bacterium]